MDEPLYAVVAVDMTARQKVRMLARAANRSRGEADSDQPLFHAYHYAVPSALVEQLVPGQLLWVPFGQERRQGLLVGFETHAPVPSVREIAAIAQAEPFLQPYQIELARWLSERYLAPLWDTLLLMLPPGILQRGERILQRTASPVTMPLSRAARRILSWVEGQGGKSALRDIVGVVGSEKLARSATSDLLQEGLLRDSWIAKPPGVRPRTERFVSLVPSHGRPEGAFQRLGRLSRQADLLEVLVAADGSSPLPDLLDHTGASERVLAALIEKGLVEVVPRVFVQRVHLGQEQLTAAQQEALKWLDGWPADEPLPLRTMVAAGIRGVTVEGLVSKGYARLVGEERDLVRLLAPQYRVPSITDEMRGTESYRALLEFLEESPEDMPVTAIYQATGSEWRHIEALENAGLVRVESREVLRNPLAERVIPPTEPPPFTPEQAAVWAVLERTISRSTSPSLMDAGQVFLLHGVTGSGKTEVYLRAVAETLARGKQAIVLVPEIALTPQTIARFGSRFGELIGLQHSELSQGERYDEWRRLKDGRAQVAIGSRSAIFSPVPHPGLIVIDEEHEWTYKQGHLRGFRFPQYNTRDVAEKLAMLTGATVILGSATPSLESYWRAEKGRYRLLEMGQRVMAQLPAVQAPQKEAVPANETQARSGQLSPVWVVDMRQELREGNTSIFSRALKEVVQETLDAQQQAILFLNRRGAHSFLMCRDCGWVLVCERCDISMTSHRGVPYLLCHQCNAAAPVPSFCANCLSPRVKHFGVGTQQVEEQVKQQFPQARVLRWDRDTARGKGAHERLLGRFAAGQADILVGTQMIAKGLDLPLVTLVGIISADTSLHLPDFRGAERTFQLLTQVAGRAGRGHLPGRVVLQTYTPLHYAIQAASRHNFQEFYHYERQFRREHAYPPFAPLVKLLYADASARATEEAAHAVANDLRLRLSQLGLPGTEVIGPAPAFFSKLQGKYRWQILIRGLHARDLARSTPVGVGWEVDVDPITTL